MTKRSGSGLSRYATRCLCLVLVLAILLAFISFRLLFTLPDFSEEQTEHVSEAQKPWMENTFDSIDAALQKQYIGLQAEDVPGLDFNKKWNRVELLQKLKAMGKPHDPLLQRKFRNLTNQQNVSSRGQFRFMNWNMLAQGIAVGSAKQFERCPKEALNWNFRRLRILEEILETDPDVIGLQEIDHFGFLHQALKSVGYEGFFYPKPNSPPLHSKSIEGPDGCAMFYKENKFNLVEKDAITLRASDQYTNHVLVILTLEPTNSQPRSQFTVATTHLKSQSGSMYDDIRQQQGEYLLQYLAKKAGSTPLIVCGDFNAEPSSPVYSSFIKSTLGLHSAYTLLSDKHDEEPPFTNIEFRGSFPNEEDISHTLDYIWFTKASLTVRGLRLIPTPEEIGEDRLPAYRYPSYHLSLAADFIIN